MKQVVVVDQPRAKIVSALQAEVRRMEGGRRVEAGLPFSSGCPALDRLLPGKGFSRGALIEWLGRDGGGAGILAMIAAREAAREGGAVVVMDRMGSFYPPAAAALAVDLESVIVIRARRPQDEIWALDQTLRCAGVAAVWAPLERLDWRSFRRLQLGAESGVAVGLLLRPVEARGQPSWSDVQLFVEPCGGRGPWRWRVELTRCRGGASGAAVELEIDETTGALREASSRHETHGLPLAAQLAHPATRRRAARA